MKRFLLFLLVSALCNVLSAQTVFEQSYETKGQKPFEVNVPVPDGNYLVTVVLGDRRNEGRTTVKAESRRLMVNDIITAKKENRTLQFVVNKRDATIREGGSDVAVVTLKSREYGKLDWDDNLNLEICGEAPVVSYIKVEHVSDVVTLFLCGDSTVVDQDIEPWASWGQMAPAFFDTGIAVANYAESGERADTFIGAGRLRKALTQAKPGDYFFIEFGHNDQKLSGPGYGGYYFFATQLKKFVDMIRAVGAIPVFITPTMRRSFGPDGKNQATHADYPDGMKWVAERENVPLIDLQQMSGLFYEALGEEGSKSAFVHYKAGSFPGMTSDTEDNTHFNPYGAYELAKCVLQGMKDLNLPVASHIKDFDGFNPSAPDAKESFVWPLSPYRTFGKQVLEKDDAATVVK